MCVLCGESITHLHWTEESRHASGRGGGAGDSQVGDPQGGLRRERLARASSADRLVRFYGLKLATTPGREYLLSDGKGRSVLVGDLGTLWPEAARLAGRPVDPLNHELVRSLTGAGDDTGKA